MKKNTKKSLIFICSTIACLAFAAGCDSGENSSSSSPSGGDITGPTNLSQSAVTDFSVNAQGIATFTQEQGISYTLYRDTTELAPIESGDDLTELVTTTVSSYSVVKDEREGYDQSPKSNAVKISKPSGLTDVALVDGKLTYTATDTPYQVVVTGKDIGEITATVGLDIMEYLTIGANETYLVSEGSVSGNTVVLGAKSNTLSIYLHEQVQTTVDKTGAINFNDVDGFAYTISSEFVEETTVVSGENISEILNTLSAGNTMFTLSVTGSVNGDSYYLVNAENKNADFVVKRYKAPESVCITGTNRLSFASEGDILELYVDGNYVADVEYGAKIYQYLKKGDTKISLIVKSTDEAWKSVPCAELTHTLQSYVSATFADGSGAQHYMDKNGLTVVGNAGTKISYSETISLKDTDRLLRLLPVWTTNAFGLERVIIRLTDAFDETKGVEFVMVNGLKIGYGSGTYFAGGALGKVSEYSPARYTPMANKQESIAFATADLKIKYNFTEKKFYVWLHAGNYYYGIKSDFGVEEGESLFSEENEDGLVKLSIEFVSGTEASGFTIKEIAGHSFAFNGEEGLFFDNDGKWPWKNI